MERDRGQFIIIEGIGGAGKTTQIEFVKELLTNNKMDTVVTREPGGIAASEDIRDLIFSLRDKNLIGPEGQTVLFFGARMLWMKNLVIPYLQNGKNVVTDRCHTSTAAYQGYAEGGDLGKIEKISEVVLGKYKPDAVIFIDVSAETAKKRKTDVAGDPYDKEGLDYQNRLILGYQKMAKENWGGIAWYSVNGENTVDQVSEEIKLILEKIFKKSFK